MTIQRLLLLGKDEIEFGSHRLVELAGTGLAAAMSVGADPDSPSKISKGDPAQPNEDALLVIDDGRHCLFAVADAHHGIESSHVLMELLNQAVTSPALQRAQLAALIELLFDPNADEDSRSECAFLVTVFDRDQGSGFGLSWGDASFLVLRPDSAPELSNTHDSHWVSAARPAELASWRAKPFRFTAKPGDLLLAHTDGVDGCHYGDPANSVGKEQLGELFAEHGAEPGTFVKALTELALQGVHGQPGGQDNIAIIGVRV